MKNRFIYIGIIVLLAACNNSSTTTTTDDATPNQTGVQNVNGNMPDTSNSININATEHQDSSRVKDSVKR
jgi:hypothetical protein